MSVRNSNCNLGSSYTYKILHTSYVIVDDLPIDDLANPLYHKSRLIYSIV